MTQEDRIEFDRLESKLDNFLDVYYRTHHIDFSEFRDKIYFKNDVYLPEKIAFFDANTPAEQQSAITKPTGGLNIDAEARTAIDDIIDKLKTLGLTL